MSTAEQNRIEELLRKSLLGGKTIDTQFHLFSTRSVSSDRVTGPRVLCANNVLLTNSSPYFFDLLNSTTSTDVSLIEITGGDQEVPSETRMDDYGYGSDSDLDDDDPPSKPQKARSSTLPSAFPLPKNLVLELDDELSEDGPDSVASDIFILNPEKDRKSDEAGPSGSEVTVQGSRHGVVWYTLLYYLYTGKVNFLPLKSARTQSQKSLSSSLETPMCSAKSMYRLADKVGLKVLRDKAFTFLRTNITEQNILTELTSSLIPRYPPLLEMELDVLYSYIASGPIVAGLPALVRRIAHNEFPHGADIVIGLHQRLLTERHSMALHSPPQERIHVPCDPKEKVVQQRKPEKGSSTGGMKKKKKKNVTSKILST